MRSVLNKTRDVLGGTLFSLAEFLLASLIILTDFEVYGALIFAALICIKLVICDDILAIFNPVFMVSVFVTNCYNSYDTFIKYVYAIIPAALCILFHIVAYKKKCKVGESFYGLIAVTVAIMLGGIGKVPLEEYLKPMNLYYYLGLGVGMMLIYVFMKSRLAAESKRDVFEKFAVCMTFLGMIAVVNVVNYFAEYLSQTEIRDLSVYTELHYLSRNNLSTYIMFALPFPLYLSKKNPFWPLASMMMYVAMIFTGSRGGLFMGSLEFALCMAYWIWDSDSKRTRNIKMISTWAAVILGAIILLPTLIEFLRFRLESADGWIIISKDEVRYKTLVALTERFKDQWLFGEGLLSDVNKQFYNPRQGGTNWYHMMIPQIVGSFGIVGVIAYSYQIFGRFGLIFRRIDRTSLALGLSYLGILLMSQVNPGEFCPLPYGALAVIIFALLEIHIGRDGALDRLDGASAYGDQKNSDPEKEE